MLERGGYTFLIPSSWETDVPKTGVFKAGYINHEDDVFPEIRKQLCQNWLLWSFPRSWSSKTCYRGSSFLDEER